MQLIELPPPTEPLLRITWLRENEPGCLSADFDIPVSTATLRPTLHQLLTGVSADVVNGLTSRIFAITRPGQEIALHLPYIDRHNWSRRADVFARTTFRLHGGSLLPSNLAEPANLNRYYARILAAGSFKPCADTVISAPGTFLPVGLFSAWRMLPHEKRGSYFHALSPATVAIQNTLRMITAEAWFADLDNCARVEHSCAMLAYAASSPFFGRPHAEFAYDLMRNKWVISAFHASMRPIDRLLARLRKRFDAADRSDLRALYATTTGRGIVAGVRRDRARVRGIFAAEQNIINAFVLFASEAREQSDPREFARQTVAFVEQLDIRLNRFNAGPLTSYVPLILIEATRAASAASFQSRLAA